MKYKAELTIEITADIYIGSEVLPTPGTSKQGVINSLYQIINAAEQQRVQLSVKALACNTVEDPL